VQASNRRRLWPADSSVERMREFLVAEERDDAAEAVRRTAWRPSRACHIGREEIDLVAGEGSATTFSKR
jgi:hypothetical protein